MMNEDYKIISRLICMLFINTCLLSSICAQTDIQELVTDRPDQTESSTVVPLHSLQIETGFVMENSESDFIKLKSYAFNTTLLRYGLLANFELRLGLEYLGDKTKYENTKTDYSISGFSPIYAGFKIKVANEETWKPEIAFLGGLVLPFTAGEDYKPEYSAANLRFAFSHTLSEQFSIGYNLGAEWDGETAIPAYFYSFVISHALTDKLGLFLESYGTIPEEGNAEHMLDIGFTYLIGANFQFDISGGIGINDYAIDNFISMGLTYRYPY